MEAFYELPWPPSVNTYWRHGPHGTYLNKPGREFRKSGLTMIANQEARTFGAARVAVVIELFPPDKRKRDLDNHCKGILDILTHAKIIDDDEQIDLLKVVRREVVSQGTAYITIEAIEPQ